VFIDHHCVILSLVVKMNSKTRLGKGENAIKTLAQITATSALMVAYIVMIGAASHWQASAARRYCQKQQRPSRLLIRRAASTAMELRLWRRHC
jgi:hypothetical protein